jgi:hypothetical protein
MNYTLKEETRTTYPLDPETLQPLKDPVVEEIPDEEKVIVKTEEKVEEIKVETIEREINTRRLKMIDAFEAYNNYAIANNSMYSEVGVKIEHPIYDLLETDNKIEYINNAKIST